jgi:phosphatidylglycerophosphatase A
MLNSLSRLIATFVWMGYAPFAPGTAGSAGAVVLIWFTLLWSPESRVLFWLVVLVVGTWASMEVCRNTNTQDNQTIVIDEVLGMAITTALCVQDSKELLAAFILFRIFDVIKLFPARSLDRWSKKVTTVTRWTYWRYGFGVIADDLVAGVQALGVWYFLKQGGWFF